MVNILSAVSQLALLLGATSGSYAADATIEATYPEIVAEGEGTIEGVESAKVEATHPGTVESTHLEVVEPAQVGAHPDKVQHEAMEAPQPQIVEPPHSATVEATHTEEVEAPASLEGAPPEATHFKDASTTQPVAIGPSQLASIEPPNSDTVEEPEAAEVTQLETAPVTHPTPMSQPQPAINDAPEDEALQSTMSVEAVHAETVKNTNAESVKVVHPRLAPLETGKAANPEVAGTVESEAIMPETVQATKPSIEGMPGAVQAGHAHNETNEAMPPGAMGLVPAGVEATQSEPAVPLHTPPRKAALVPQRQTDVPLYVPSPPKPAGTVVTTHSEEAHALGDAHAEKDFRWCAVDGSQVIDELLDAGVFAWAASQRCEKDALASGQAVKCAVDIASAAESVNRMITVMMMTLDKCGVFKPPTNPRLGVAISKLTTHFAGLTAASGSVIQECPNPIQNLTNLTMEDTLRAQESPSEAKNGSAIWTYPHQGEEWFQHEAAHCIMDLKDSANQIFKAGTRISAAGKDCDQTGKCVYHVVDILSTFAGLTKFLMGTVDNCYSGPLPIEDFPLTCSGQIANLLRELGELVVDAGELEKLLSTPPAHPWFQRPPFVGGFDTHDGLQYTIENINAPERMISVDPIGQVQGSNLTGQEPSSRWIFHRIGNSLSVALESYTARGQYLAVGNTMARRLQLNYSDPSTVPGNGAAIGLRSDPQNELTEWIIRETTTPQAQIAFSLENVRAQGKFLNVANGTSVQLWDNPMLPGSLWIVRPQPPITTSRPSPTMVIMVPVGKKRLYDKDISTPAPDLYRASLARGVADHIFSRDCKGQHCQSIFAISTGTLAALLLLPFASVCSFLLGARPVRHRLEEQSAAIDSNGVDAQSERFLPVLSARELQLASDWVGRSSHRTIDTKLDESVQVLHTCDEISDLEQALRAEHVSHIESQDGI
jgi:hypothetical protein